MPIPSTPSPLATIIATGTYDSNWFSGATLEARITTAIAKAKADGAPRVLVHGPYDASLVTFDTSVQMVLEGEDWGVFNVLAYGATKTSDDTAAFTAALAGAFANVQYFGTTLAGVPKVIVPTRASPNGSTLSYNIKSSLALPKGIVLEGDGMFAALIRFIPSADGKVLFTSYGTAEAQGPTALVRNLFLYNGGAAGTNVALRVRNFDGLTLDHVILSNFEEGLWADWGQNVSIKNCQLSQNIRAIQLGGNLVQTETPAPPAGIRGGAFAPNFMDSVRIENTSFSQNQCDINYCGSQYGDGGLLVQGCRFFESAGSPVAGKFTFIRMSGSQSAHIHRCEFESPNNRQVLSIANTGLDADANGPNWGVEVSGNTFLCTTALATVIGIDVERGAAWIHGNTFIFATGVTPGQPIVLNDSTSPSVIGPNTYMTFVNGAVPTEGFGKGVIITAEPNGGHAVLFEGQSPLQITLLNGAAASVAPDAPQSPYQKIRVTTNGAFTINNPTNPHVGFDLTFHIENASGGAMGAITFGSEFRLAGAFTNPANGQVRTITFHRDKLDGTAKWREVTRSTADQPV